MTVHPKTLKILEAHDEPLVVLDAAPAKCKQLDRGYFDSLERIAPGRSVEIARDMAKRNGAPPGQALEADLVATDVGLAYVHYYMGGAVWGRWDDVVAVRQTRRSILGASVTVQVDFEEGPPWVLTVGKRAAQSLVAIAMQRIQR